MCQSGLAPRWSVGQTNNFLRSWKPCSTRSHCMVIEKVECIVSPVFEGDREDKTLHRGMSGGPKRQCATGKLSAGCWVFADSFMRTHAKENHTKPKKDWARTRDDIWACESTWHTHSHLQNTPRFRTACKTETKPLQRRTEKTYKMKARPIMWLTLTWLLHLWGSWFTYTMAGIQTALKRELQRKQV